MDRTELEENLEQIYRQISEADDYDIIELLELKASDIAIMLNGLD